MTMVNRFRHWHQLHWTLKSVYPGPAVWTNTWVAFQVSVSSCGSAGTKSVSEELPSGCSFSRFPSVTVNTQNSPRRLFNLPDSPGMTSFPSALVPDIPVKPSSRCTHSSRVSGIRNKLPYTVLPGPVSGKKENVPAMTLFGRYCRPVYHHVSTTGCEKGLFCQQMACCSTQRCEGPDPRLWLLADGLATSSPISSALLINIAPLAGIQSRWDPLLSRTVRQIPEMSSSLIPLLSAESLLDSFSLERYWEQSSGTRAILF